MSAITRIPYNPKLRNIAKKLRKDGIISEAMVWKYIKNKQSGVDFNRQKPLGNYIVDFYCIPLKLAIEIDGASHDFKDDYDYKREQELKKFGIRILKFSDQQVKENCEGVISTIRRCVKDLLENTPSATRAATPLKRGESF